MHLYEPSGETFGKILKAVTLGWLNRLLGVILSLFAAVLLIGIILSLLEYVNANWFVIIPKDKLAESKGIQLISDFSKTVFPYLKEFFK